MGVVWAAPTYSSAVSRGSGDGICMLTSPCCHTHQGRDWGGFGDIATEHYLAAADVPDAASVSGVIAFLFACYGGGTPLEDRFAHEPGAAPPEIAPRPFAAALPGRLLTHPAGGALACIAHVERAWGYSISGQTMEPQIGPFRRALGRLMLGQPVGLAVQEFNDKCAVASVSLANLLENAVRHAPASTRVTLSARKEGEVRLLHRY